MTQTENQDDVIAFLSDPRSHRDAAHIARIDTHCSVLFLTGERAYKLKRAITLPYLDYGSVEKRRACCQAELELNSRTAPQIYQSVQAISRRADGGLQFGAGGKIVDWVVVMTQFDPEALFDRLLAAGQLNPIMLRETADAIAAFHAGAEITKDRGGAAGLGDAIAGNWQTFETLDPALFGPGKLARLRAASKDALARLTPLLERRRLAGHCRRCHGDLHLGNICLYAGRPLLFDCIEFSDSIACIDVLYDVAFAVMDLLHRGAARFACDLFNRYLDRADEAGGLAAMPLFLSVRAAIRAHVTGMMAEQDGALRLGANEYLDQALDFLTPRPARLAAIGGLSGTGKSTLALALAPGLGHAPGARVLRSDVIRKRILGAAPETRLDASAYDPAVTARVYETLSGETAHCLAAGYSVIADAVFANPAERTAIESVARAADAPFTGIWLDASADTMRGRVAARQNDASDATADIVARQLTYDPGVIAWRRLDANRPVEDIAAAARPFL